jgi:hypothetical protein
VRGTCIAERVGRVQTRDGSDRFPFQDSFTHHAYACETFRALRVARGHSFQRFSVTKDMVALTPMFRRGGGGEFYQFEAWDAEAYRLDRPEDVRSFLAEEGMTLQDAIRTGVKGHSSHGYSLHVKPYISTCTSHGTSTIDWTSTTTCFGPIGFGCL